MVYNRFRVQRMRCTGGPRGAPRIDGGQGNASAKGESHGAWNSVVAARCTHPGHSAAGDVLASLTAAQPPAFGRAGGLDLASLEQVAQAAHAVPAVAVAFHDEAMVTGSVRAAVIAGQQIHEQPAGIAHAG